QELYDNIFGLYEWISEQIRQMQLLKQPVNIDTIIHVITQLKEGYEGVMKHESSKDTFG
ncbi:flagellar protein FliS, partial [Listeria monocytogenes]|nr:flagellar protein FliS [Listeria monocytogenes]